MKILLIGASGMIGSRVLKEAVSRGHTVVAASRHPEKIPDAPGVTKITLFAGDADSIALAAADVDVIVSSVSPRTTGNPVSEANAVGDALIATAEKLGKRLFVVGGFSSLRPADGTDLMAIIPEQYRGEAMGLRDVLGKLRRSSLIWTFFSPAAVIAPGERTGKFRIAGTEPVRDESGESRISAEDYAVALVSELEKPRYLKGQMTIGY